MAVTTTESSQTEREANINAVVKFMNHVYPPRRGAGLARLPTNGNNAGSATNVRGVSETVQIVCVNHNGHPV